MNTSEGFRINFYYFFHYGTIECDLIFFGCQIGQKVNQLPTKWKN